MSEESRAPGRPKDEELQARRCEEILAAATSAFARHGYHQTDVQLIAYKLGIGKGTIYRYFSTKQKLFLAAVERGLDQLSEYTCGLLEQEKPVMERMRDACFGYFDFFDQNPDIAELLIQERAEFCERGKSLFFDHESRDHDHWDQLMDELEQEGRLRSPADREKMHRAVENMVYGIVFTSRFSPHYASFREQAADIFDIICYGTLKQNQEN
ncbi:TetR/AcrR family transcriptional regulator [Desulfurispirillum indicum]|uniref:Regulatory protein TetR n=1 Tax=Desulfurispirillum indicum (strain ATCC BAA-1389 / DSM 22839 / S5) TaxID=653733 RepID=E6W5V8_DESIS|nr:TetR/AcrR family transcriptional regulator [Desulfurispirillum indicum]ADU67243.1 regulatory protein TetR [Desulfurispirillum indicum S5]UCZ56593.1 TetR/AcrR family transcriptional regulator [Desulfurispirillum indicum]